VLRAGRALPFAPLALPLLFPPKSCIEPLLELLERLVGPTRRPMASSPPLACELATLLRRLLEVLAGRLLLEEFGLSPA
jgi:hypothetical protein